MPFTPVLLPRPNPGVRAGRWCHDRISTMSAAHNVAMKGGVGSKNDRRAGTHFFEPGGYKIEPLLTKMVNDDI